MVRQFGVLNAAEELPQPLQYYVDNAPSVKISPDPDFN
jgi:hypothetical protein